MTQPIIKIENLTKRFGADGTPAISDINLEVFPGQIYGVIGLSGAGKSTLMRCLTLLEKPSEGNIFIQEQEMTRLCCSELRKARRRMGKIFQHFNLFSSRTAAGNISYPLEIEKVPAEERKKRVAELLELVGLGGRGDHYPAQLSGGQKQRVAIARALANRPAVLLCDEATSALDPKTTQSILELLADLNRRLGITIVLITHEMEVIKQICTQVAVLEKGEIVEQGEVADLFACPTHPTTRRFLQNLVHGLPESLLEKGEGSELLRLCFRGEGADKPIISRMIKAFDVEANILLGGIDKLQSGVIGNLVIELKGSEEARGGARLFLDQEGVICEVIR